MKRVFSLLLAAGAIIAFSQIAFAQVDKMAEKHANKSGVLVVESFTSTATVDAIDYENRTGTIKLPDGTTKIFKAGPEVGNFNLLKVGDPVLIRN